MASLSANRKKGPVQRKLFADARKSKKNSSISKVFSVLDHRHLLHSDSAFSQRRFECRSFPGSPLPAGKLSNASASEKNLFSPDKEQEYVFL